MKPLTHGLILSLALAAGQTEAETTVFIEGAEYKLSALLENCNRLSKTPEAQIACFNALTKLVNEQKDGPPKPTVSVEDAHATLQATATHHGDSTGLQVSGADCRITVVHYDNFFHISRRNVSTIDARSVEFDLTDLSGSSLAPRDTAASMVTAVMRDGAHAVTRGGLALESSSHAFDPKPGSLSIRDYANQVIDALPDVAVQEFDLMLVHPDRAAESAEIWQAFQTLINACAP